MPKFQVGDKVRPIHDYVHKGLFRNKTYEVEAVGITCDPRQPGVNVKLLGISGTTPHEGNLVLVAPAAKPAGLARSTFVPGDMVEAVNGSTGSFTIGGVYTVAKVQPGVPYDTLWFDCDDRGKTNCWLSCNFKLWSKPAHIGGSPLQAPLVPGDPVPMGQPAAQPWERYEPTDEPESKTADELRKERIWAALKGAAKQ